MEGEHGLARVENPCHEGTCSGATFVPHSGQMPERFPVKLYPQVRHAPEGSSRNLRIKMAAGRMAVAKRRGQRGMVARGWYVVTTPL